MKTNNTIFILILLTMIHGSRLGATQAQEHEQANVQSAIHTSEHEPESGDAHQHHEENGDEEAGRVHLNTNQQHAAGIQVETLKSRVIPEEIEAPGELKLNLYATSQITPRIEVQVSKRHARLGDHVKKGQALITLSSADMAEAQGALIIAAREWQRVKKLGLKVVSEQRYLESRVAYQQAWARLLAYGATRKQIDSLMQNPDVTRADGSFTLFSPQDGTIIQDNFVIGQMVEPGDLLFEITDESTIWVQAHVNPDLMERVKRGAPARIRADNKWYQGKIVQIYHALDETTRTMQVRVELPNPGDHLHPGQFVTTYIGLAGASDPVLALPREAILRSPDGDWEVFVEQEPGEFEPVEVNLVRQLPGLAVIDGLPEGTRVVVRGAFFIQSELAKSGFAVHNH
ncbi:efflux RND transporter periplasmic adaptor subunit [Thiolapillus sp.]